MDILVTTSIRLFCAGAVLAGLLVVYVFLGSALLERWLSSDSALLGFLQRYLRPVVPSHGDAGLSVENITRWSGRHVGFIPLELLMIGQLYRAALRGDVDLLFFGGAFCLFAAVGFHGWLLVIRRVFSRLLARHEATSLDALETKLSSPVRTA